MKVVLCLVIFLVIPYLMYLDAQKRQLKVAPWFICSLLFPFVAWVVYLIVALRKPKVQGFTKRPYGFRSKSPWKMVVASAAYVFFGIFVAAAASAPSQPASQTTGSQPSSTQTTKPVVTETPSKPAPSSSKPDTKTQTTPTTQTASGETSTPQGTSVQCRSNPLAGVYHPYRLKVIESCKTVSGTVDIIRHESDGDYHVNVKLDPQYANLINAKNTQYEHGDLVVEIIPMDQGSVPVPHAGEHITFTGAYVDDTAHGWMEIHPVWNINGQGSGTYTAAAATQSANSPTDDDEESTPSTDTGQTSSEQPTPVPSQSSGVQVVSVTSPVSHGSYATLNARVTPGATASIEVDYNSGPSTASGLGSKSAGSDGSVSWTWKVGSRTAPGTYTIIVSCDGASATTHFTVQ